MRESLEHALELIGYGKELPEDEAIGIGCGWWPTFSQPSGAHVKLNADGSGTIVTGAQECGTGAVMGLPLLAAEVLAMRPEDFSILYQDTDAGPWDGGASGSQTTFNNGRAVIEAATDVREQLLELAEEALEAARPTWSSPTASVRVKGSPTKSVTIADARGHRARRPAADRQGLGVAAGAARGRRLGVRRAGWGWSRGSPPPSSPTWCTARSTARPAWCGCWTSPRRTTSGRILNPIGAEGQVDGGVVMGIGMALLEGTQISADGHQINPHLLDYKLQTMSDAPPIKQRFVDVIDPDGPYGGKGIGEPPCVPTPGAIGNAISQVAGVQVKRLPMTPDPSVGGDRGGGRMSRHLRRRSGRSTRRSTALAAGARPIAGGTDLYVGHRSGKAPLPDALVAIHRLDELRGIGEDGGALTLGALVKPRAHHGAPGASASGSRRSPTRRRSSARTRPATSARSAATS